jgi:hypothetical protein
MNAPYAFISLHGLHIEPPLTSPQYDFAPLHYYDVTVDGFKKYVSKWHKRFGTVWITEFACQVCIFDGSRLA